MVQTSIKSILLAGLCITGIAANADPISPKVKVRGDKPIAPLSLDNRWTIVVDVTDTRLMFNAEYLRDHLMEEFGLQMEIGPYVRNNNNFRTKRTIVLGKASNLNISDLILGKKLNCRSANWS